MVDKASQDLDLPTASVAFFLHSCCALATLTCLWYLNCIKLFVLSAQKVLSQVCLFKWSSPTTQTITDLKFANLQFPPKGQVVPGLPC